MVIKNISGIFPNREPLDPVRSKKSPEVQGKTDKVDISPEAREKQSVQVILNKAKSALKELPDVRKDIVDSVSNKVKNGYDLEESYKSGIADRLLDKKYI